jgi:hypothetical protein
VISAHDQIAELNELKIAGLKDLKDWVDIGTVGTKVRFSRNVAEDKGLGGYWHPKLSKNFGRIGT